MNELFNILPPQSCYLIFGLRLPYWLNFFIIGLVLYKAFKWLLKKKYFRWFLIFFLPTIIYIKLIRNDFFFQSDDFAHLKIAAEYSFGEIFSKAMGPSGLWGFHHIFTGLWLFKAIFIFFKTRIEAYILVNFFLHLVNLSLLYFILAKINKKKIISIFGILLFAGFYLPWISSIWELTMAFFVLLALFFWLEWLSSFRNKYLMISFSAFIMSLFSYEKSALLPIGLFLISVSYHFLKKKINFKKLIYSLSPFFLISLIHFLVYGKIYFNFFNLSGDGYSSQLSLPILFENLLSYLTLSFPIINSSILVAALFILILVLFDLWQRKLVLLPLFFAYFIFLLPALFFEQKIASYYAYTPSFFLAILFVVFLSKIYPLFHQIIKKRKFLLKIFNIYFVLFFVIGIFRLDKLLMDNCFLIHFPWENEHRLALNSISEKIDNLFQEGKIEEGVIIKLEEKEITHEMKYLFTTNGLYLFLKDEKAIDYLFVYNEEEDSLTVKKESAYHRMSF